MEGSGRREKAVRNLLYAWLNQGVMLIMNIVVRIVFVRVLSKEYLGLSGLFGNIISLLSLAELGVGTAIVYSLYEPLANRDEDTICTLMRFYKRVYIAVGTAILVIGALLMPFLPFFIKDMPDIPEIRRIYLLFVVNSAASYFFSYKSSLISADQSDYLIKKVKLWVTLVMYILQIGILLLSGNYCLFLLVQIGATVSQNVAGSWLADRMYPFLANKTVNTMPEALLRQIWKNTRALMLHKVGDIMVFSTDNLIISKFVGLAEVGIYSNYTLIQQALNSILSQIFTSMTAGVGNLGVLETSEKKCEVFKRVFFLNAWIYGFCSIAFGCMAQDFIRAFFGESFTIGHGVLAFIIINFYLTGMRKTTLTFRDALGLFWQNRYMPLGEALINLTVSLALVVPYGVGGVLAGTAVSTLLLPWWIEPYIIFRHGLKLKVGRYWKWYVQYGVVTVAAALATLRICRWIPMEQTLLRLMCKACVCLVVPNVIYILVYGRSDEYKYYRDFAGKLKEKIMENGKVRTWLDWCAAGILAVLFAALYVSKTYYDKIIGYAPMLAFVVLFLLFCIHVDIKQEIRNKNRELLLLVAGVAVAGINLTLTNSGYGAIFNIADFLLVLYLADKVKFSPAMYGALGGVCLAVFASWLNQGDKGFNTNLASLILFAMAGFGMTALTAFLEKYGKDAWGKWLTLLIMIAVLLPMIIELRARCVLIGIGVFVFLNYCIPPVVWKWKWLYRACVLLLVAGSIGFPLWYIDLWESGKTVEMVTLGKSFFSGRNILWGQFLTAFYKEPFTGIGSDFITKVPDAVFTEVHNGLLNILIVYGIPVFAITVFFFVKRMFQIGISAPEKPVIRQCVSMITAMAAVSIFENYFVLPFYSVIVMLLFSIAVDIEKRNSFK